MRANVPGLFLSLIFAATACWAQEPAAPSAISSTQTAPTATQPDTTAVYCSGFITDHRVPEEVQIVSGEQSSYKVQFARGDYVHLNRGSSQGIRVGDRFSVVRPTTDPMKLVWFKWQTKLLKAMGTRYADLGALQVVNTLPNVSVAQVTFSCGPMQRGDLIRPYEDRPVGPYKPASQFNHFAPVSGKPVGMVVQGNGDTQVIGTNSTVYINLGSGQGVKLGDYVRLFRYQGSTAETAPNSKDYQYKIYGFGSAPSRFTWKDLPREVLGEGIVLNVSTNSSTVFVSYTTSEVYTGDYIELE
jgi:hypothetical protein